MTLNDGLYLFGTTAILSLGVMLLMVATSVQKFTCFGREALVCGGLAFMTAAFLRYASFWHWISLETGAIANGLLLAAFALILFEIVYLRWVHDHAKPV